MDAITDLLLTARADEARVVDELVPLVYEELRRMAHRFLAGESNASTLATTALVHEAYLKLVGHQEIPGRGRAYFFGAAARAMRQVLVDAARHRARHGGGRPLTISRLDPAADEPETQVLAVDEALAALAVRYPRQAQVVECRFFGGLSVEETAEALAISPRTVKRDWSLAQAWLARELQRPGLNAPAGGEAGPPRCR
jgi:RNA polymerase sigma factor (TIGR02999 family)